MSNIPKKSGIARPHSVRISTTTTSRIPETNSVRTESRTIEAEIPESGAAGSSCTGPCSTSGRQLIPQSTSAPGKRSLQLPRATSQIQSQLSSPQTRQLTAPQSRGLISPQARQLTPRAGRLATSEKEQLRNPQASQIAPQPSRQLVPPKTRQLATPQARQLVPPQMTTSQVAPQPRQLVLPQTRQLPTPQARQIPSQMNQLSESELRLPKSLQVPQPVITREAPRLRQPTAVARPSIPGSSTAAGVSALRPPTALQISQRTMPCPSMTTQPSGLRPPSTVHTGIPAEAPSRQIQPPGAPKLLRPPSALRPPKKTVDQAVHETLMAEADVQPDQKIVAKGKKLTKVCIPETIETPAGPEPVVQKAVLEKKIVRDEAGERIVKNLAVSDVDERGVTRKTALGIQQFDPQYPKSDGGKETVAVTSTISITPSFKTFAKESTRVTVKPGLGISPQEVALLVEEEKEDVENTLKMVPADIILEPGKYEMKKRQQRLRLHSESMALLEQSIIQPGPTADESQAEPTPEVMVRMMDTVEKGISPQSEPDEVFNSLFESETTEQFIKVSSVTPGPLQDVVIPTEVSTTVHMEAVSENMTQLTEKMNTRGTMEEPPEVDIFTRVMSDEQKSPKGKGKERKYQALVDEKSLWVNANMEYLVNVIGAEPAEVVDPYNLDELIKSGKLEEELANGIDYFVEADPIQYMSRVQLRGTEMPPYFPGYMVALPEFPEIVKIAKTPDEVYASAWKAVQPKYFDDSSMLSRTA